MPGFLFFQWWTHINSQNKAELERRVRNRLPAGQQVFSQPPVQQKLSNPIRLDEAAAPAVAPEAAPALIEAAGPAPVAVSSVSVETAARQTPEASVLQTGVIAQIVLARDPLLSPFDAVRIAEAEAKARHAQEELEAAALQRVEAPAVKKKIYQEPSVESLVELQGVVSTEEGIRAIVNGEAVVEGDFVGKVKVVKISPSSVVFLYRNKRFIKTISK